MFGSQKAQFINRPIKIDGMFSSFKTRMMNIKVFLQTPKHYSHLRRLQVYVTQVIVFGVLVLGPANICTVQQYSCVVPNISSEKRHPGII